MQAALPSLTRHFTVERPQAQKPSSHGPASALEFTPSFTCATADIEHIGARALVGLAVAEAFAGSRYAR
jgi:hypothetical protein